MDYKNTYVEPISIAYNWWIKIEKQWQEQWQEIVNSIDNTNTVLQLLDKFANYDLNYTPIDQNPIIYYAALHNNIELVKYLLNKNVKLDTLNWDCDTIFDVVTDKKQYDVLKLLIESGKYDWHAKEDHALKKILKSEYNINFKKYVNKKLRKYFYNIIKNNSKFKEINLIKIIINYGW